MPTTGHIPELPGMPRGLRHLGTLGLLARSVDDLARALPLIAGPDGRQWEVPPVPLEQESPLKWADLRIAWTEDFGIPTDDPTRAAIEQLAAVLSKTVPSIHHGHPEDLNIREAVEVATGLFNAEVPRTPEAQPGEREVTMREYIRLLTRRDRLIGSMEGFFESFDVLLCPVVGTPAWTHREPGTPVVVAGQEYPYWHTAMGHCMPFNLTGHPAVVIPLDRSPEGLPTGLQIVGRRWGEARLLAVARLLSETTGPFQPPPGFQDATDL